MRRFLRKTFFAVLLFGLLAAALDALITWRSHGKQYERYADFNVINSGGSAAEVLILGNSRARYHFDPRVLSERLGARCYNLGMIGYPLLDQLGKLRYHLAHNPAPEMVIVNLDPASWEFLSRDTIGQYEQFLDDIRDPLVFNMVKDKTGFRYADLLPWARFAGYPGYVWKIVSGDTIKNCFGGFVADPIVMPPAALKQVIPPYSHMSQSFDAYLAALREHRKVYWPGVKVVFVESPYFERDRTEILPHLAGRLEAYENLVPLDMSWVHDTVLFMNRSHLNEAGAAYFSNLLADSLLARGLQPH